MKTAARVQPMGSMRLSVTTGITCQSCCSLVTCQAPLHHATQVIQRHRLCMLACGSSALRAIPVFNVLQHTSNILGPRWAAPHNICLSITVVLPRILISVPNCISAGESERECPLAQCQCLDGMTKPQRALATMHLFTHAFMSTGFTIWTR